MLLMITDVPDNTIYLVFGVIIERMSENYVNLEWKLCSIDNMISTTVSE